MATSERGCGSVEMRYLDCGCLDGEKVERAENSCAGAREQARGFNGQVLCQISSLSRRQPTLKLVEKNGEFNCVRAHEYTKRMRMHQQNNTRRKLPLRIACGEHFTAHYGSALILSCRTSHVFSRFIASHTVSHRSLYYYMRVDNSRLFVNSKE